jgi:putative N6-adenine-specific DNA methylase
MRKYTNDAPIRENLASGILRLCGWKPGIPLFDPMCGSGTFLLEAALATLNVAPGIDRSFAFEKLKNFSADLWNKIKIDALKKEKDVEEAMIFGSDIDPVAIKITKMNLEGLGLEDCVKVRVRNFLKTSAPTESGILVTNLPYGERLSDVKEMKELYPRIGDVLKNGFPGWDAFLMTSDLKMPKSIRLSVSRRIPLFNGALECRLYHYKMVSGSNRG